MLLRLYDRFPNLVRVLLSPGAKAAATLLVVLLVVMPALRADTATAAERIDTRLRFDAFGLIYKDGTYDYVFAGLMTTPPKGFPWCTERRNTRVFRVVPDGPDTLIGSDRSDLIGFAAVEMHDPDLATVPGRYYATVGKVRRETRRGTLECGGDRSATLTVQEPQFHRAAGGAADQARARFGELRR